MADNRATAMRFLLGKGLTRAQAAGVVGSLMQESGLDTGAKNPDSGAYGIGQWLHGRKTNLLNQGDSKSLGGQLNFLWSELQGPEKAALNRLKSAHTVADAAGAFTWGFERPGKAEANMANRVAQGHAALKLAGGSGGATTGDTTTGTTTTTVQTDPSASVVAALDALELPKREKPQVTTQIQAPSFAARPVMAGAQIQTEAPEAKPSVLDALKKLEIKEPQTTTTTTETSGGAQTGATGAQTGSGAFKVDGPNPGRLKPELTSFADKVANVFGGSLVGKDGSTHSKYTVNGNVSEHYTGNATDIFQINGKPAQGKRLLRAGRAALIAAGMPRAKALKAQGGLYNVGSHQIIFLTNEGGDHFDHLHISSHAR